MQDARRYFEILELQPGASLEQIKQAYRELALVWHPDRFANAPQLRLKAEQKMREINAAYEFLISYRPSPDAASTDRTAQRASTPRGAERSSHSPHRAPASTSNVLCLEATRIMPAQMADLESVTLSPDGKIAWGGGADLRAWNTTTGEEIAAWRHHELDVTVLVVSPCGRYLLVGGNYTVFGAGGRQEARIYEAQTGRELLRLKGIRGRPNAAAFTLNGEMALTGDSSGSIRLYETAAGRQLRQYSNTLSPSTVRRLAFCDQGRQFVSLKTGNVIDEILLWETRSATALKELTVHMRDCTRYGQIQDIAVSPDGRMLLAANNDPLNHAWTLHLWNILTGEETHTLAGHEARIRQVSYAENGRWALSGSDDKTVRLWDAAGRELCRFVGHTRPVSCVAFASGSALALSGSADGTVRLWTIPYELQRAIQG